MSGIIPAIKPISSIKYRPIFHFGFPVEPWNYLYKEPVKNAQKARTAMAAIRY